MSLLNILKRYTVEDAKDLEKENTQLKSISGINAVEAWEVEKIKDNPRSFDSFLKQETINLDKQ